ncbi:class II fructose-bisphosphate aldolase [Buchnera aphidicola]|jgi:fructose-bisphosphate aldolase class II|uniref:Fructose-bisphosphate aldolase class 2 n=1 Tax=Buchnera aphidicola subsp. Schizaphis graminum (strain Sg) TaxID=198804 RepID=ALF_BUCAP|nr:class II fructose-bisphosphate aldolase [Buchnera aphidicola]Q8K9B2.1 RecName: Full=Fructose-bisphosphate aldolase class 2; Short=FBP aldolase; Short=FBPA; AltName: Full=Fructose-1,6-bisphosphate aldolase; AltName: Full=Fructose-bisphosphate aldolase class II [Buchnera aphidicola str. Sg (Schizaphis graminum)]AAM67979.1 fructose-bisphosphate aldolase [Buchnera aphidicola str. Sg (Schizaphis graminum)]AWI49528.1 class II fructose-bisphosphate aldolase [Buchnera aphidicola (Schizaphis graminum)
MKILNLIQPGVVTGNECQIIFELAKKKKFAIPAVNCIGTDSINAVLETASRVKSPVIIQFSYGGASFIAGYKRTSSKNPEDQAIQGSISGAQHVHLMSQYYQIPVILHTDHCSKEMLPWIDGLLEEGKKHYKNFGKPLFTSHMIDLSKEHLKENIAICSNYLKKIKKINMILEIELGCTGGEEDGIDNSNIDKKLLYTQPKDVNYAYKKLSKISTNFTIAASFGNVHGVYQPGNVNLKPNILKESQEYVSTKHNLKKLPLNLVFHGGSGSDLKEIHESIEYGIVKMNIDTDIQWASWKGVFNFYKKNKDFLQKQIGNKNGKNIPNKKYYDPRSWIRESQESMSKRLEKTFKDLNAFNIL